jgi:hypothetical protein
MQPWPRLSEGQPALTVVGEKVVEDVVLAAEEDGRLLAYGLGVTNPVDRPTASAADLEREELRAGP